MTEKENNTYNEIEAQDHGAAEVQQVHLDRAAVLKLELLVFDDIADIGCFRFGRSSWMGAEFALEDIAIGIDSEAQDHDGAGPFFAEEFGRFDEHVDGEDDQAAEDAAWARVRAILIKDSEGAVVAEDSVTTLAEGTATSRPPHAERDRPTRPEASAQSPESRSRFGRGRVGKGLRLLELVGEGVLVVAATAVVGVGILLVAMVGLVQVAAGGMALSDGLSHPATWVTVSTAIPALVKLVALVREHSAVDRKGQPRKRSRDDDSL
ncbi:hypothetical protein OHB26_38690 (plasmid) [Nocardia sp. NBC_01503]|uniref:hypothetical protein n=1 Tax=Nocardia sp. NBC_01503 TaxID=2975997 RepID=UPI002E7BBF2C|nr:hypothetical protein [Nocardia sp. NBC_01503]WTL36606.1 hypothetical protein OHB26_38690 [Nocardia sp. NBC_01503]